MKKRRRKGKNLNQIGLLHETNAVYTATNRITIFVYIYIFTNKILHIKTHSLQKI